MIHLVVTGSGISTKIPTQAKPAWVGHPQSIVVGRATRPGFETWEVLTNRRLSSCLLDHNDR
jgi:hypothetical protein